MKRVGLETQWREALRYLRECRNYIYFVFVVFLFSALIGFFQAERFGFIEKLLEEILNTIYGMDGAELIFFILQNNLQSALFGLFLGVFLGIFPLVNAVGNGVILGFVAERVVSDVGYVELLRIFPHGIFELPAVFISLGLGIKFGMFVFARDKAREFKRLFYNSANVFLFVVVPLLVIGAFIEGILIVLG